MSVRRTVMKLGRVVSVHSEQTQSRLLEKTHQSNGNLHKNDSVLMPKGDFKLAPNPVGVFIPFKSLVPIRYGTQAFPQA